MFENLMTKGLSYAQASMIPCHCLGICDHSLEPLLTQQISMFSTFEYFWHFLTVAFGVCTGLWMNLSRDVTRNMLCRVNLGSDEFAKK